MVAPRRLSPLLACTGLGWAGGAVMAVAFAWWALLFPTVVANTGLSFGEAIPCVASNSDICLLETALCGGRHWLGIRHYSPTLFWCGVGLLSAGLLGCSILPSTRRHGPPAPTAASGTE